MRLVAGHRAEWGVLHSCEYHKEKAEFEAEECVMSEGKCNPQAGQLETRRRG